MKQTPRFLVGLLAAVLLLTGCSTAVSAPVQPTPAPPAQTTPVPTVPPTAPGAQPLLRITAVDQGAGEAVIRAYFDALVRSDWAAMYKTWDAAHQPSGTDSGTTSGITGVKRLELRDWQTTNSTELRFNMTVELTVTDHNRTAWGPGPNSRAVRLVKENDAWKIDAMASGPPWPQITNGGVSNGTTGS